MIRFKDGVKFYKNGKGVKPQTIEGMYKVAKAYCEEVNYWIRNECSHKEASSWSYPRELTITSVMDGRHSKNSLHHEGKAFDSRTWEDNKGNQLPDSRKQRLAELYRNVLGPDWDVVVESTHIHCEYDPD